MKYFVDAKARIASGHEKYVEFQIPNHKKEVWDEESLYLPEAVLSETGFGKFWADCVRKDIVFDMDTISKAEMSEMVRAAQSYKDDVVGIANELKAWAEKYLLEENQTIAVVWECDRILLKG